MQSGWGSGDTSEVLSTVEYSQVEKERPYLRSCAWLDACSHAQIWWRDHQQRPFYVVSVASYEVIAAPASNRLLFSHFEPLDQQTKAPRPACALELRCTFAACGLYRCPCRPQMLL